MAQPAPPSDLEKLQEAEQRLLSALDAAQQVAALLSAGGTQQELERLCASFVADAQESQLALLALASKHEQPLPLQNSDYRSRLALAAARAQLRAAEAQLADGEGGGAAGAAGTGSAAGAAGTEVAAMQTDGT